MRWRGLPCTGSGAQGPLCSDFYHLSDIKSIQQQQRDSKRLQRHWELWPTDAETHKEKQTTTSSCSSTCSCRQHHKMMMEKQNEFAFTSLVPLFRNPSVGDMEHILDEGGHQSSDFRLCLLSGEHRLHSCTKGGVNWYCLSLCSVQDFTVYRDKAFTDLTFVSTHHDRLKRISYHFLCR